MREYSIGANDAGQRLDAFLGKACPGLASSLIQKLVRQKRVKVNGKRAEPSARLCEGDTVNVYVYEERLAEYARENAVPEAPPEVNIVYEDENILLADKPQGLLSHPDDEGRETDTLIGRIQSYLRMTGEYDPAQENTFAPSLCNRIDRNTCGIVIAAKNAQALREMNEHIRAREVEKRYLCVVHGRMERSTGRLENCRFLSAGSSQDARIRSARSSRRRDIRCSATANTAETNKTARTARRGRRCARTGRRFTSRTKTVCSATSTGGASASEACRLRRNSACA